MLEEQGTVGASPLTSKQLCAPTSALLWFALLALRAVRMWEHQCEERDVRHGVALYREMVNVFGFNMSH